MPIFLILVIILFCCAVLFGVLHDIRTAKDSNGCNSLNSFGITCPVCKNKGLWLKARACQIAVTTEINAIKNLKVVCESCKADLSGLYFSHRFVREALTEAGNLKGSKELSMQFLEELAKLRNEYTSALGGSYGGEVSDVSTNAKVPRSRNHS